MFTGNICKSSIAGSVMEGGVASTLYAGSLKHSGSFTCVMVIRMSASARCGYSVVILLSAKRRRNDGVIMDIYTKRIWSFFPVARANFFSVENDGPLTPEARLLSILVMAVALVPMRSATSAWVRPASLRAASISSSSANSSAMASYSALKAGSSIHLAAISSCVMVGGLRLPVMLNLLHSGFSFFAFSRWGFLSLLDETVQHDDAFSCQSAVKDACDAITAFNPKLEKSVTEGAGMRFSEIAAVYFYALNKMLVSGAHTQWKLIDLQSDLFTVVFDSIVHELKHNKIVMFAQCVDSTIPGRYTAQAPYKAGAGRENPRFNIEHNRAHAVFSCHEHRYALIMVGRAGPTSVGPGSMLTGFSPLYVSPPIAVRSLGGEFIEFNIGAVTMTTLPTQSHPEITIINGRVVTTSLAVANYFTKRHERVLDRIRNLECSAEFTEHNFVLSDYTDCTGRKLPCYQITRDGFAFLAMGFTGKRAARFKEAYINAFNQMERSLSGAGAADMSSVAQNARGVYLHLREIHQIWKSQLYPMLNAVESPLASKLYDRVGDAVFGAALVDSRLNGSDKEVRP